MWHKFEMQVQWQSERTLATTRISQNSSLEGWKKKRLHTLNALRAFGADLAFIAMSKLGRGVFVGSGRLLGGKVDGSDVVYEGLESWDLGLVFIYQRGRNC